MSRLAMGMPLFLVLLAYSVAASDLLDDFPNVQSLLGSVTCAEIEKAVPSSDSAVLKQYLSFLNTHPKHNPFTSVQEFLTRLDNFKAHLEKAAKHQKESNGTAVHGVTKFADFSSSEFQKLFTGHKSVPESERAKRPTKPTPNIPHRSKRQTSLPSSLDYRQYNVFGNIKDQGQCGDCYSFATNGVLESVTALTCGTAPGNYSEQEILDCTSSFNNGCDGGYTSYTYDWIKGLPGITGESNYPYIAEQHSSCQTPSNSPTYTRNITDVLFAPQNESAYYEYLYYYGPLSLAISSSQLQTYVSGILNPQEPSGGWDIDHNTVLIGYDTDASTGTPYWIVRNSWGESWGEQGYFRLIRGTNALGITTDVEGVTVGCS